MSTTWCPQVASPAYNLVGQAHDKFTALGLSTYNMVIGSLDDMDDIPLDPYEFNISFNFDGQLTPFVRPPRPTLNTSDFNLNAPADVGPAPEFFGSPVDFVDAPPIDALPPSLTFGQRPVSPNVPLPQAPGDPAPLVMPDSPDYVLPDVPTLESLNLPDAPEIVLPLFTSTLPTLVEPPFNETWSFMPSAYEDILKDELLAALNPMLQAKQALPEAIESAIFQKGRSRIEIETSREEATAVDLWAGRGFDAPPGMLNATRQQIRQGGQNRIAEFNRDAVIEQFKATLENLRFGIVQGAALEGVYIQLWVEEQRFLLEAAKFERESTIAVLNYRLSVFNARMQGYETEARVFGERIRAELSKVELYRAQIEGERARGEINQQRVQIYTAQINAVNAMAEFYKTQVDAVKVQADVARLVYERYKVQIDAYDSRWRANVAEWQGFSAGVEAEGKRADVYKTLVDAQSKRIDGWATGENLKIERAKLGISEHGQKLDVFRAKLADRASDLDAERARLAAVAQRVQAQATLYTADASVEQSASAASDRQYELAMANANAELQAQLKTADMMIAQAKNLTDQLIAIAEAKLRTGTQLTASTLSAVGYNANVSASVSNSAGCQTSFNFSGETADAGV